MSCSDGRRLLGAASCERGYLQWKFWALVYLQQWPGCPCAIESHRTGMSGWPRRQAWRSVIWSDRWEKTGTVCTSGSTWRSSQRRSYSRRRLRVVSTATWTQTIQSSDVAVEASSCWTVTFSDWGAGLWSVKRRCDWILFGALSLLGCYHFRVASLPSGRRCLTL